MTIGWFHRAADRHARRAGGARAGVAGAAGTHLIGARRDLPIADVAADVVGRVRRDRELMLLSVRDEQRLVGVVPLMREGARLSFAGDTEVCDYMDFPCTPGRETELLAALFRSLGEEPWDELSLWAMREDSPCAGGAAGGRAEFGLSVRERRRGRLPADRADGGLRGVRLVARQEGPPRAAAQAAQAPAGRRGRARGDRIAGGR